MRVPAHKRWLVIGAAVLGAGLRLWLATLGHNYDLESYLVVGEAGFDTNVYAFTSRYNYGPIWWVITNIAYGVTSLLGGGTVLFHVVVAALLTSTDAAIAWFLSRRFDLTMGLLFFLNPVTILITGFHSQFDNLALLVALLAVDRYARDPEHAGLTGRQRRALALLGVSLMIKHIAIVFPLWLAFRRSERRARVAVIAIPFGVFLAGFLPFVWSWDRIVDNVFLYRSDPNAPLLANVFGYGFAATWIPTMFFLVAVLALGWWTRHRNAIDSLLLYTIGLVAAAPAVANQYLAIPVAAGVRFRQWLFYAYSLAVTLFLLIDSDGLSWDLGIYLTPGRFYGLATLLLALMLVAILRDHTRSINAHA